MRLSPVKTAARRHRVPNRAGCCKTCRFHTGSGASATPPVAPHAHQSRHGRNRREGRHASFRPGPIAWCRHVAPRPQDPAHRQALHRPYRSENNVDKTITYDFSFDGRTTRRQAPAHLWAESATPAALTMSVGTALTPTGPVQTDGAGSIVRHAQCSSKGHLDGSAITRTRHNKWFPYRNTSGAHPAARQQPLCPQAECRPAPPHRGGADATLLPGGRMTK